MDARKPTDKEIVAALNEASGAWAKLMETLERASTTQRAVVLSACPITALSRRDLRLTLNAWAVVAGEELVRASALLDLTA